MLNVIVIGMLFCVVAEGEIVVVGSPPVISKIVVFTVSIFPAKSTEKYLIVVVSFITKASVNFVEAVVGVDPSSV